MRHGNGFTLLELLMVVVIIGILAAIAIPKLSKTKERAYLAAMASDLHNLVTAEESYFGDHVAYTGNLGTLYRTSAGVTVSIAAPGGAGWSATATHNGTTKVCQVFMGTAVIAGQTEGAPSCH